MSNEIFSNCPTGILTQQMTTTSIPQRWTDENQTEKVKQITQHITLQMNATKFTDFFSFFLACTTRSA